MERPNDKHSAVLNNNHNGRSEPASRNLLATPQLMVGTVGIQTRSEYAHSGVPRSEWFNTAPWSIRDRNLGSAFPSALQQQESQNLGQKQEEVSNTLHRVSQLPRPQFWDELPAGFPSQQQHGGLAQMQPQMHPQGLVSNYGQQQQQQQPGSHGRVFAHHPQRPNSAYQFPLQETNGHHSAATSPSPSSRAQVERTAPGSASAAQHRPRQRAGAACQNCKAQRTKCERAEDMEACHACTKAYGSEASQACVYPSKAGSNLARQVRKRGGTGMRPVKVTKSGDIEVLPTNEAEGSSLGPEEYMGYLPESLLPETQPARHDTHVGAASQNVTVQREATEGSNVQNGSVHVGPQNVLQQAALPQETLPQADFVSHPLAKWVASGYRHFVECYFQLGLLHKDRFLEEAQATLTNAPGDTSRFKFLFAAVLTISARYTTEVIEVFGTPEQATDYFTGMAQDQAELLQDDDSIECAQAFLLLAVTEWSQGNLQRSRGHLELASKVALRLGLHLERTYDIEKSAADVKDMFIEKESARRTFWMIFSQLNLQRRRGEVNSFDVLNINARLPCVERDFHLRTLDLTGTRAVMDAIISDVQSKDIASPPTRCMFGILVQAYARWGKIARTACLNHPDFGLQDPSDPGSAFCAIIRDLKRFEAALPGHRYTFSEEALGSWKREGLHLAYLSITMTLRLSNIVIRRMYLHEMNNALLDSEEVSKNARVFWEDTIHGLYREVVELYRQIGAFVKLRVEKPVEGQPQVLPFCVYVCGSLASYLWKYPRLAPHWAYEPYRKLGGTGSPGAERMANCCLGVLLKLSASSSESWGQIATAMAARSPRRAQTESSREANGHLSIAAVATATSSFSVGGRCLLNKEEPPQPGEEESATRRQPLAAPEDFFRQLSGAYPRSDLLSWVVSAIDTGGISLEEAAEAMFEHEMSAFRNGDFS